MRGPYQEARRIPHSLQQLAQNPMGHKWQVTLHPQEGDAVKCPSGKTVHDAFLNAGTVIRDQFPGATL